MLSSIDKLTELVRDLESKHYIFTTDPLMITEELKGKTDDQLLDSIRLRAKLIDSNNQLSQVIDTTSIRLDFIILTASVVWFVSSFASLFAILNSQIVNFFYILVYFLGLNSLMFILWVVTALISRDGKPSFFTTICTNVLVSKHFIPANNQIAKATIGIYKRQVFHSGMHWYVGKISHQLWIATLGGMLLALILLLMMKEYTFSWQSTLLSTDTIVTLINWLSWLPELIGFPTPSNEQIIASQLNGQTSDSRLIVVNNITNKAISSYEWAMLLIGSLLVYGIVPRVAMCFFCDIMYKRNKMKLDITLPYYQKLINYWAAEIVDIDNFSTHNEISNNQHSSNLQITQTIGIRTTPTLVALLEHDSPSHDWYENRLVKVGNIADFSIEYFGKIESRDELNDVITELSITPMQVILGVSVYTLPDRGSIRKIERIAKTTTQGLIVIFIHHNVEDEIQEKTDRAEQWLEALKEKNIMYII